MNQLANKYILLHKWEGSTEELKICRVELCTELFYAIISTFILCFLLICYPHISFHVLFLYYYTMT